MGAAQIGFVIGSFALALLFAAVWLIFCMVIPGLRKNPDVSYGVAMVLAVLPALMTATGINIYNIAGSGLCIALLVWQLRRAKTRLAAAAAKSRADN